MRLVLVRLKKRLARSQAPHNTEGGALRQMVQRLAHSPVYGMEIRDGHWWAHTAWGHHPVQWYLEQARPRALEEYRNVA